MCVCMVPITILQVTLHRAAFSLQLSIEPLSISITCTTKNHQFVDSTLTLEVDESEVFTLRKLLRHSDKAIHGWGSHEAVFSFFSFQKNYVINLKVTNTGRTDVHFISCTRLGSSDNFTLTDEHGGTEIPSLLLPPGDNISIRMYSPDKQPQFYLLFYIFF